jgi:hypothetical protein
MKPPKSYYSSLGAYHLDRNPQTGERMTIDAMTVVTFKSAGNLKWEINHGSHNCKGG